jgi:hypothetical protein
MGTVFFRSLPDLEAVTFAPNPRFLKTVEGDYNLIDVSGALIEATVLVDRFDPDTGYPTQGRQRTVIDLRAEPEADGVDGAGSRRYFLGTHIDDVAERRMYRVYLDRDGDGDAIVALLDAYEYADGAWSAVPQPGDTVRIPLVSPLSCTLSRELKRDDPAVFQALIDVALRQAENICADTDMKAAVWNGVVTRLDVRKIGDNREARTQRWRVGITARFGDATLDYLVRRDEQGAPIDYCPAPDDDSRARWPDFLWQDFPDVGSKGYEGHDWIVNDTMVERGIVTMRTQRDVPGDFYVFDDHIKNVYELIYAGLAGYSHTIVHGNKRYGFKDPARWDEARDELDRRADALTFE